MAFKARFSNAIEWGKMHSPEILLVTGLIEGAVGTVLACKTTIKAHDILEKHKAEEPKTQKEKLSTAIDICRVYAIPTTLHLVSGISICAGFGILKVENGKLLATCGTLTTTLMEYRSRVRDEIGAEKEEALYYGTEKEVISVKITQKDGKKKTVNKKFDVRKTNSLSPYAQKFDPYANGGSYDPYWVDSFIARVETVLDDQLKAYGHLYLNDARKELELERDDVGQLVGWLYDPHRFKDGERDNAVKIIKKDIFVEHEGGHDQEIWLDFNVDGVIFGKMAQKEYEAGLCEPGDQGLEFSNKEAG